MEDDKQIVIQWRKIPDNNFYEYEVHFERYPTLEGSARFTDFFEMQKFIKDLKNETYAWNTV